MKTEIQKTERAGPLVSQEPMDIGYLEGAEKTDLELPVVHIFQGTGIEVQKYGEHTPGDVLDSDSAEKIEDTRFLAVLGWREWVIWREPRTEGIEAVYTDPADLAQNDITWGPNGEPPRAQEFIVWAVLFAGDDVPRLIRFTNRGLRAGKRLMTLVAAKRGRQLFELGTTKTSNAKGTWFIPTVKDAGRTDDAAYEAAKQWFATLRAIGSTGLRVERATEEDTSVEFP